MQMITDSIQPHEWILVIDDLSDLSASTGRLIDPLNKRFTICAETAPL